MARHAFAGIVNIKWPRKIRKMHRIRAHTGFVHEVKNGM